MFTLSRFRVQQSGKGLWEEKAVEKNLLAAETYKDLIGMCQNAFYGFPFNISGFISLKSPERETILSSCSQCLRGSERKI